MLEVLKNVLKLIRTPSIKHPFCPYILDEQKISENITPLCGVYMHGADYDVYFIERPSGECVKEIHEKDGDIKTKSIDNKPVSIKKELSKNPLFVEYKTNKKNVLKIRK